MVHFEHKNNIVAWAKNLIDYVEALPDEAKNHKDVQLVELLADRLQAWEKLSTRHDDIPMDFTAEEKQAVQEHRLIDAVNKYRSRTGYPLGLCVKHIHESRRIYERIAKIGH